MTTDSTPADNRNPAGSAATSRTKGIVSLILGIVSLGAFFPILGLSGIAAVILGVLSRRSEPNAKAFALTGIILGVIGTIIGVIFFVLNIIVVSQVVQEQGL